MDDAAADTMQVMSVPTTGGSPTIKVPRVGAKAVAVHGASVFFAMGLEALFVPL